MAIPILHETNFTNLGRKVPNTKVRDVYEQDERTILVTTDRHSSFDRIIAHIPGKGAVLNMMSAFWFGETRDIVPNHFIAVPDPNVTVAIPCEPVMVEAIVRGYLTGTTSTSIWTHYSKGQRDFGDFVLPNGLPKNYRFEKPLFTPSTKEKTHDITLSMREIVERGVAPKKQLDDIRDISLALFARGQQIATQRGLILVDTKYEFGISPDGQLMLIDEVHSPDSSRWWYAATYEERFAKDLEPEYFDKEFLRLWFVQHCDPYHDEVLPEAPAEMVEELSRRYQTLYTDVTDATLEPITGDITERIARNLELYAV